MERLGSHEEWIRCFLFHGTTVSRHGGNFYGLMRTNRILPEERQRVLPKLILTGYPMYGPSLNNKDARVLSLQSLPVGTQVLAISGTKDDFINSEKSVPKQLPSGNPRAVWDIANDALSYKNNSSFHHHPNRYCWCWWRWRWEPNYYILFPTQKIR